MRGWTVSFSCALAAFAAAVGGLAVAQSSPRADLFDIQGYWQGTAGIYAITDKAVFLNGGVADQARHPIFVIEQTVASNGDERPFARTLLFGEAQATQIQLLREKDELMMGFPTGPVRLSKFQTSMDPRCFDTRPNPEALFGVWRLDSGATITFGRERVVIEGVTQRVLRYRVVKRNLAVFDIAREDADAGLTKGQSNPIYAGVPLGMDAAVLYVPNARGGLDEISMVRPVSTCFKRPG
ncbi:MAG: hypothetical protein ACFB0F_18110 [Neomegalonema sp.]